MWEYLCRWKWLWPIWTERCGKRKMVLLRGLVVRCFFFFFLVPHLCKTPSWSDLQQIILKSDCCWHILLSRGHEPLKLSDILATAGLSLSYELFLALKGVAAWVKYITTSNYSSVWQQLLTNAMSHLRWHLKCYNLNNFVIMAGTS